MISMNKKTARVFLLVLASSFSASLPAQVLRHETTTINIEIPVRVFKMTEYDPKIREALNYFVDEVLLPGDELVIVTPMKTYRMKSEMFSDADRARVFEQLLGILRRDILIGSADYRDVLEDMKALALTMVGAVGLISTNSQSPMAGHPFGSSGSVL